jgi:hypothetical protein
MHMTGVYAMDIPCPKNSSRNHRHCVAVTHPPAPRRKNHQAMIRNSGVILPGRLITIWLFKIAMENGPFIDGLPIKNGDFPWLC